MATTITAGNATNGLAFSADNTGILELKTGTGSGTTALTLDTSQNATFAGTVSVAGNLSFNSGYGSTAVAYGCRAWVNFNGTGTVAIRASGNVSSITDNSTGNYTVNFTTAMPNVNYVACSMPGSGGTTTGAITTVAQTTTSYQMSYANTAGGFTDTSFAGVAIFR
jgi:hypothetical protein